MKFKILKFLLITATLYTGIYTVCPNKSICTTLETKEPNPNTYHFDLVKHAFIKHTQTKKQKIKKVGQKMSFVFLRSPELKVKTKILQVHTQITNSKTFDFQTQKSRLRVVVLKPGKYDEYLLNRNVNNLRKRKINVVFLKRRNKLARMTGLSAISPMCGVRI